MVSKARHTSDHELYNGTTTERFKLIRDDNGSAMYNVENFVPNYRNPLKIIQSNWIDGHGQYEVNPISSQNGTNTAYLEGQSIDTTQDGVVFLGPLITTVGTVDAAVVGFYWYKAQSKWMCWSATNAYVYSTTWTVTTTALSGVTAMAEYDGVLYAAMGASTLYYYSTTGTTWTQTDLTDGYANGFLVAPNTAGTQNVLWKFKTPNEISNTTNGKTVAASGVQWETATFVGDTSHNITNISLHNNKILIGKGDNLFELDSGGGVHPLRPDLKTNASTNNFKYVCEWQTSTYHSEERGGGEISAYDTYNPVWPLQDAQNIGKIGDTVGIASDKNWLYWGVKEPTNYIIYKGRETVSGNRLIWQWCSWIFLSTSVCGAIAVCQHSTTDRRLWFGYGTTNTGYVILSDDPLADTAARFTTSGWVRMSYDYGTNPMFDKMLQSSVVDVAGLASGVTLQIKYRSDTGSATECVATGTFGTTNGIVEKNFSAALTGKRIQFEIWLASGTSTVTPQVRYFEAKGIEKPTTVKYHNATYAIGDEPTNRAETLRSFFRTARTTTTLLKFADLRYDGTTGGTAGTDYVYCVIEPDFPREVEIVHEKDGRVELGIQIKLREVSFS